ncbi:MAG: radical SAM protein [Pseudomonadota bacterium]
MNQETSAAPVHSIPAQTGKFRDPERTVSGTARASVALQQLDTLWFNTGTLCNLACPSCYIESSPTNDALVYIGTDEVKAYLDEIENLSLPTREIAFTGGEPFMNPDMIPILELCLGRGFDVLILTNAMRPMRRFETQLLGLPHRDKMTIRVSLDHHSEAIHEKERGVGSWQKALDGIDWLAANGFVITVAGRLADAESEHRVRADYAALFAAREWPVDAGNPAELTLFPEMDVGRDVPEITTDCWDILNVRPDAMMCASSRMIVKRKGEASPRVAACTLIPHDRGFDLGGTLEESREEVALNHPFCAQFCVLGGASCSG